jgi:cardiolipin synthase
MPSASSLRPLWDRAAEWACRLAMIREAKRFLYLSTYYIEYDEYGVELLAALLQAQRRGVAVNLLVDRFGQRLGGVLMTRDLRATLAARLNELRDAGTVVTFYQPRHYLQRQLGGGQHVKIQISEAGEAIFGSSNISRSSFEAWNEFSVSLRGPVVRTLLESYRAIGGAVDDDHLRHLDDERANASGDMALEYWLCNPNTHQGRWGPLGWRGRNEVTDRMIDMLDAAQDTVQLTSFYFKPVEPLMTALVGAARRGVHVEVYHSHRHALPATDLAWIAAAVGYEQLLNAGVQVRENLHGEHSKILLVDNAWVAFGSYNFEDAAHDRLAEAMLATRDDRAVAHASAIFEALRRDPDNVLIHEGILRGLPRRVKLRRLVLGRFKRWM